jgi:hypothetical protein
MEDRVSTSAPGKRRHRVCDAAERPLGAKEQRPYAEALRKNPGTGLTDVDVRLLRSASAPLVPNEGCQKARQRGQHGGNDDCHSNHPFSAPPSGNSGAGLALVLISGALLQPSPLDKSTPQTHFARRPYLSCGLAPSSSGSMAVCGGGGGGGGGDATLENNTSRSNLVITRTAQAHRLQFASAGITRGL